MVQVFADCMILIHIDSYCNIVSVCLPSASKFIAGREAHLPTSSRRCCQGEGQATHWTQGMWLVLILTCHCASLCVAVRVHGMAVRQMGGNIRQRSAVYHLAWLMIDYGILWLLSSGIVGICWKCLAFPQKLLVPVPQWEGILRMCGHDKDPMQLGFECSDMLRRKFNSL